MIKRNNLSKITDIVKINDNKEVYIEPFRFHKYQLIEKFRSTNIIKCKTGYTYKSVKKTHKRPM